MANEADKRCRKILQDNMKDLQSQLGNAHKRISELITDRDSAFW